MKDLIDRQAAISLPAKPREDRYFQTQSLDDAYDYGWRDLQRCIEKLPPAQRWIPVSERLPESYTDVLVWFEYYRYGDYNRLYQMHGIGTYSKEYDSWIINHETGWKKLRVFAWMPLPSPWEGGEE